MATPNFLTNPTKDHPLYNSFVKTGLINRIIKLAVLAVIIICLISAYFTPVFTISKTIKSSAVSSDEVIYKNSVSYTMSELLDEQKKLNDEELYFADVEESVAYLRNKDFSEIERIKNLEKAYDKINNRLKTSNVIETEIYELADKYPAAYIALAEEADAITRYVENNNGKLIPDINSAKVAIYVKDLEYAKIDNLTKTFTKELEARNTDGVYEFLSQAELLGEAYTDEYVAAMNDLASKYLVADYTIDEEFCANLYEFMDVRRFIPASAMTEDIALSIDVYDDMASSFLASYANSNIKEYESEYIYFTYDVDTDEVVYEQHSLVNSLNKATTVMKYGTMIAIAIAVIAMIPTVIGIITKKQKKLRNLAIMYVLLPIEGTMTFFTACTMSGISSKSNATAATAEGVEAICDLGNIISSTLLVAVLVLVAVIATKIMISIYGSKFRKWQKTAQAEFEAQQAAAAEQAPAEEESN